MEIEEIREIINNANSVALVLDENPEEQKILAREALRIFFQNRGMTVCLFPENPEEIKNKWSPLFTNNHKNPPLSSEISILIPKNRFGVKEISYEEDDELLAIKILADGDNAQKDDILLNIKPTTFDILVCIGSFDIKFDNFKEKIILAADNKTLSEKVFEIIGDEASPNLLFTSLLLETNGFKKGVTKNSLNLGQRLLSLGADKKIIDEIMNKEFSLSFAQILGRALARTRLDESLQSNWTFVSKTDTEKTGILDIDISLIRRIAKEVKEIVPPQPVFIALWENKENNVWVLLTVKKEEGERETVAGPYKSFSEAELKIKQRLKEIVL